MKKNVKNPFILGFYGQSGIGKTYLLRQIVKQLSAEGNHIAVIKISDKDISVDTEGKDTFLYGEAGADMVVFSSASESAFLVKQPLSTQGIVQNLQHQGSFDFIFIEGAMESWIPKIRLGEMKERENTLFTYNDDFDTLLNMIKHRKIERKII
ncbi:MAG TPA: molybdopterin-guanine dinucleotide biosynthesis protein B [Anaerolineaceae bacterium]|nr:molybdopterin-guanine dinucleotide biosynthesis protein B [Anaerolineaceae bacterium]